MLIGSGKENQLNITYLQVAVPTLGDFLRCPIWYLVVLGAMVLLLFIFSSFAVYYAEREEIRELVEDDLETKGE